MWRFTGFHYSIIQTMGVLSNIYWKIRKFVLNESMERLKEKVIDIAIPVFAEYERDRRNFFSMLATISATIGAFSFLLFPLENVVKNLTMLIVGDGLLLLTIIFSVLVYMFILRSSQRKFHKVYYDNFEILINREYEKLLKYKRPKFEEYYLESIACLFFVSALIFIGISFI